LRVCRVLPDVTAVDRVFDYTFDDGADLRVGTIVRVPLHGRKVRGWVVAVDVEPATDKLLAIDKVVSAGPSPEIVDLSEWIARRWCGPRAAVLRSGGPPNNVPPSPTTVCAFVGRAQPLIAQTVVRQPPLLDRREQVAALCASEGSTIVCVADAGRSRALAKYLRDAGRAVAIMHSFEKDAERTRAWRRATEGECIVIGGRIAALAPVPDLAAAIVVDDADEALQEERSPTWHAREVLRERAERAGVPFTICSPVPTIEAGPVTRAPARDVEIRGWPRVQVVDRREDPPGAGLLSSELADALRTSDGLRVCVLNRKGRFRLLVCPSGHLLRWDKADEKPMVCPDCGAPKLKSLRAGVKRVREELEALVPGSRVVDVDAETEAVPAADILIGTEAVLHRAAVRRRRPALVAYLDLDQELLAPRYRAASQAHWLATRGAQLLAGRPRNQTRLLVQTRMPDHVVVRALVDADPALVAASETEYRQTLGYPPFGALAELSGDDEALVVAVDAVRVLGVQVFGPADGKALVHASDWETLADALVPADAAGRAHGRLRAAVDPPRV
jgi:primosomal protein N' (replication factor Y)